MGTQEFKSVLCMCVCVYIYISDAYLKLFIIKQSKILLMKKKKGQMDQGIITAYGKRVRCYACIVNKHFILVGHNSQGNTF